MDNRFDQWTKTLAEEEHEGSAPMPRREALRKVGLGLIGALLASLGLGGRALAAPGGKPQGSVTGGTTQKQCTDYCRRFSRKAERDRCEQVCGACSSTTRLCGTSGYDLVCCSGTCCAGVCTTLASDPSNCGACGRTCGYFPNVVTTCSNGVCGYACAEGWADCDRAAANGCEAYLVGDPNNCGACGHVCPPGRFCCGGVCVDTSSDAANCNGCGYNCLDQEGKSFCCGGICSDLTSDNYNCGACGIVCPWSTPVCQGGTCVCPTNTWCNGACTDLSRDPNNCGACGHGCPDGYSCVDGVCGCTGTFCSGACVDTNWDALNCGGCGVQCQPLEFCSFGSCYGF